MTSLDRLDVAVRSASKEISLVRMGGAVSQVTPSYYRISGLSKSVRLGDTVELQVRQGQALAEVIRVDAHDVLVKPFGRHLDVGVGTRAWRLGELTLHPHVNWRGRVIDALGRPIDGKGMLYPGETAVSLERDPPAAMKRARIETPVRTGVRAIDLFTPLCVGQRIGIFAGSGVGKSTLLAMLAKALDFETVVVALVGERGREVREFIEDALGDSLRKTVVVVATGDESPMMRRMAPKTAMAIAEHFRDMGQSVLMIMDSATRFAQAARDVAMASGEPAIARGYTPSVFTELPQLLERAGSGTSGSGAITGVFSVLVDGDDHNDPVADSIRGILDGHIVLDRAIADQGRYPAIDVLGSVSRLARVAWRPDEANLILGLKNLLARFEETRDLRLMGGYVPGVDNELDQAVQLVPKIYDVLRQGPDEDMDLATEPFRKLADALQGS